MNPQELNDFIKRNKMAGKELAAKLGVHWVTVSRWRNGREPIPKTVELALKWVESESSRIITDGENTTSSFLEMKDKILDWFATGRVGASSKAMAFAAADLPHGKNHPYDPSDLNRCLLLIEAVPEIRNQMDKVASISGTWGKLVARWDEVEQCFLDEAGLNWCKAKSAPKTYGLMKQIGC